MEANRPAQGLNSLREIGAYERERRLEERLPARTVYGAIRAAALDYPERTALTLVMTGDDDELPARLSYRALLEGITRTANLFAELAGPGAAIAYLLPSLFETHYVLWASEAVGQAVPINPLLTTEQIVELVRVSGARILVTVGPDIAPPLWEKGRASPAADAPNQAVVLGSTCGPSGDRFQPRLGDTTRRPTYVHAARRLGCRGGVLPHRRHYRDAQAGRPHQSQSTHRGSRIRDDVRARRE